MCPAKNWNVIARDIKNLSVTFHGGRDRCQCLVGTIDSDFWVSPDALALSWTRVCCFSTCTIPHRILDTSSSNKKLDRFNHSKMDQLFWVTRYLNFCLKPGKVVAGKSAARITNVRMYPLLRRSKTLRTRRNNILILLFFFFSLYNLIISFFRPFALNCLNIGPWNLTSNAEQR